MDIMLDQDGDILITQDGNIRIETVVLQKILIRLQWILGEWRWNKEAGLPYFDQLFIKNPNINQFELLIRNEIMKVKEVTSVERVIITVDRKTRSASIRFRVLFGDSKVEGEVRI